MRLRRLIVALGLLAGCSPRSASLVLPELEAASFIVAFGDSMDGPWSLGAQRIDDGRLYLTGLGDHTELRLFAYDKSLEALGITAGSPERAAPPCSRRCVLLHPHDLFRANLDAGSDRGRLGADRWERLSDEIIPDPIARLLVPDLERCLSPCGALKPTIVTLGPRSGVAFVARDTDGSALVVLESGETLRVPSSTTIEPVCASPGKEISSGFFDPLTRTLWEIGSGFFGKVDLARARPSEPCPLESIAPAFPGQIARLEGEPGGPGIYALTASGAFARFDGQTWSLLATLRLRPEEVGRGALYKALLSPAPGRAIATVGYEELAVYAGGAAEISRVEIGGIQSPDMIQSLVQTAAFGLVLGVDNVGLASEIGGQWEPIAGSRHWSKIGFAIELDDRVIIGARQGQLVQYVRDFGYCSDENLGVSVVPRLAVALSSTSFLIGQIDEGDRSAPVQVAWVDLERACP